MHICTTPVSGATEPRKGHRPDHWELELQTVGLRIEPEASGRVASTLLSHLYGSILFLFEMGPRYMTYINLKNHFVA